MVSGGYSLIAVRGLLVSVASPVAEHGAPEHVDSVVVVHETLSNPF